MSIKGWIGVDLDGTLAHYDGWQGIEHIGAPIQPMVDRVKHWLEEGKDARVFTARVAEPDPDQRGYIETIIWGWCQRHIGQKLAITNVKDFGMVELWDDRCVQVIPNTGLRADGGIMTVDSRGRVTA